MATCSFWSQSSVNLSELAVLYIACMPVLSVNCNSATVPLWWERTLQTLINSKINLYLTHYSLLLFSVPQMVSVINFLLHKDHNLSSSNSNTLLASVITSRNMQNFFVYAFMIELETSVNNTTHYLLKYI